MQENIKIGNNTLSIIPGQLQKGPLGVPFYLCSTEILKNGNVVYTYRYENKSEYFAIETDKFNNFVKRHKQNG